jgi:hypothetical protein
MTRVTEVTGYGRDSKGNRTMRGTFKKPKK